MNEFRFFLIFVLIPFGNLWTQNLVQNPSFETYTVCPMGPSEFSNAVNWSNPFINIIGDTCSTSDLYNACNPFGAFGVDVPNNILGSQAALTGNGYAGIIAYEGVALIGCTVLLGTGWREYLQGVFSSPLAAGQNYCVTVNVSLADNVKFATDDFGVRFSNSQLNINCNTVGASSALIPLGYSPQLNWAGGNITNTAGWTMMQWTYPASGGEQYITFGNFKDDAATSYACANAGAINPYAYYYVDDISVVLGPCVLPVSWKAFIGKYESGLVKLNWITETESNSNFFTIERSAESETWEDLGEVKAKTYSMVPVKYEFEDRDPIVKNFYRIRQTDNNGASTYSETIQVVKDDQGLSVYDFYPIPAENYLNFSVVLNSESRGKAHVKILDVTGREFSSEDFFLQGNEGKISLDLAGLPSGSYMLMVSDGTETSFHNFIR